MSKIATCLVISTLLLTINPAFAASEDERAQAAADTRQGLLKVVVSYFGPILGMARQQLPYDGDVVKNNAEKIAASISKYREPANIPSFIMNKSLIVSYCILET